MPQGHHLNVMTEVYGHRNQATYKLILNIIHDQDLFDHFQNVAENVDQYNLAQILREHFHELNPVQGNGVYVDLMLLILEYVDWYQIANYIIEYDND